MTLITGMKKYVGEPICYVSGGTGDNCLCYVIGIDY